MKNIMHIFINIPNKEIVEISHNTSYFFDEECYEWINTHNIEEYKFIDYTDKNGISWKLPVSYLYFSY